MVFQKLQTWLGTSVLIAALVPPSLALEPTAAQEIQQIDSMLDYVSDLRNLHDLLRDVRGQMRVTDNIEDLAGEDGIGYELRQMRSLLVKLDADLETPALGLKGASEQTNMARYVELNNQFRSWIGAVDGAITIIDAAQREEASGQDLQDLASFMSDVEGALPLLMRGLSVNPVVSAVLSLYGTALNSAGEFAENVVRPRTESVNAHIDAAGDAIGTGGEPAEVDDSDALDDALDDLEEALRARRNELYNAVDVDFQNAKIVCMRSRNTDADTLASEETDLANARRRVIQTASHLENLRGQAAALRSEIRDKTYELEVQTYRAEQRIMDANSRDPVTVQQELEALQGNLERVEEKIEELEQEIPGLYEDYRDKRVPVEDWKECIRETLTTYGKSLDNLPEQFRNCDYWSLPDRTLRTIGTIAPPATDDGQGDRTSMGTDSSGMGTGGAETEFAATNDLGDPTSGNNLVFGNDPFLNGGNMTLSVPDSYLASTNAQNVSYDGFGAPLDANLLNFGAGTDAGNIVSRYQLMIIVVINFQVPAAANQVRRQEPGGGLFRRVWAHLRPTRGPSGLSLLPTLPPRAPAVSLRSPTLQGSGGSTASRPPVQAMISSLGVSTGESFRVRVGNRASHPIQLAAAGIVVEPLNEKARRSVEKDFESASSEMAVHVENVDGYCLEFLREPPPENAVYRVAAPEVQKQFEPMRRILTAAQRLMDAGGLSPDSDPTSYFHSIRQWALWTKEGGFDLDSFGKAFVERTKKNFAASGQPWTKQIEGVVRGLVPNRWRDVEKVLQEAGVVERPGAN